MNQVTGKCVWKEDKVWKTKREEGKRTLNLSVWVSVWMDGTDGIIKRERKSHVYSQRYRVKV